jgi:hypothetical protein
MSRSIAGVVGLAVTIVVASFGATARADDNHEKAGAAFQEGRRYLEQGNCDAAITKLKESLALESSVGARLSMADCYEKSDPLLAWRNLKDAASLAYFNHDERVSVAEQRAAALEKTLPTLRVTLPSGAIDTPGFELRVDGELLDRFYYRTGIIATKPGAHVVEVTAPMRHFRGEVTAAPGMYANVAVHLEHDTCTTPQQPTTTVATVAPPERSSPRKTLGLAIAGVGVLGVAVGGVFGAITLDKKSTISALCGGNPGSCAAPPGSVDSERNAARTDATISTVAFIVGGAALVGGGVLYFTAPSPSPSMGSVRVAPSVGSNGGGALVTGAF